MHNTAENALSAEVQQHILLMLNNATSPRDLASLLSPTGLQRRPVHPDLALRLLKARNSQPGRQFESLDHVRAAEGFGVEELELLAAATQKNSATAFQQRLYANQVLYDNFELRFLPINIEATEIDSLALPELERMVRGLVARNIHQLVAADFSPAQERLAANEVRKAFLESFSSRHLASYALALWFYRFDEDNWFSFETIRREIEWMFDTYFAQQPAPVLFFFKGFSQRLLTDDGITVTDLPVTLNTREQKLYVWRGQLFD